ncbi:MAG: M78 family metallopeptidase domain-containing protein [Acidiferrobacteraceae bacterium]
MDALGNVVSTIPDNTINDAAMAGVLMGRPVIRLNMMAMQMFTPAMRLFVLFHECGHHALGQIDLQMITGVPNLSMANEQAADCWSFEHLMEDGLLSAWQVSEIQQQLARFGPGDWTHLPGPMRAINLRLCGTGDAPDNAGTGDDDASGTDDDPALPSHFGGSDGNDTPQLYQPPIYQPRCFPAPVCSYNAWGQMFCGSTLRCF